MHTTTPIQKTAASLIAFVAVVFILYILKPLIMPVLYAIILAVMIFPVQNFLEKNWKCNRLFATLCSLGIIFLITAVLISLIYLQLSSISSSGEDYSQKISNLYYSFIESVQKTFNMNNSNPLLSRDFNIGDILKGNFDKIGSFLTESGSLISNLVQ